MRPFLSEEECIDYLDAMYNDGYRYGTLIEDQLTGEMTSAADLSNELSATWNEIDALPSR